MADDDDRQPPQSYDTVAPAGVGASSGNQMSPSAWQDLYFTGDQGLLDVAMEEMEAEPLFQFMESLPPIGRDGSPAAQASSPAGVGSQGSPSFGSIQTTPPSSVDSPLTWGSTRVSPDPRRRTVAGARTAAGAGGDGNGRGERRGPRTRGGGRGGAGAGGGGGGAGGAGGAGAGGAGGGGRGGAGAGGGGGGGRGGAGGGGGGGGGGVGGGGGGGGGRRGGRRRRLFPGSPRTPSSSPSTPRGSHTPPPRTLRQADLQRSLRMLLQDQEQLAQGREIANVTMTNSIVTSYKQGGAPSVQTSSSRVSP